MTMTRHFGLPSRPPAREPISDEPLTRNQLVAVAAGFVVFTATLALLLGSILPWAFKMSGLWP